MFMSQNLYSLFAAAFPADRTKSFLETAAGEIYSYAIMEEISGRFAKLLLDLGVEPGDRVAVQTEKSPEAVMLYLACLRTGAIYLPLNSLYTAPEVDYFLGDARPRIIVATPEREAEISPIAARNEVKHVLTLGQNKSGSLMTKSRGLSPVTGAVARKSDDVAAILYTSGTTGRSKGAMLSHGNLAENGRGLKKIWDFTQDDILLHALPIFHVHGLFVALSPQLLSGAAAIFLNSFDPGEIIRLLPRASVFMGVPTYYTRLLADPRFNRAACRNIRLFTAGSAPLSPETFAEFEARTEQSIVERYGMTEAGIITSNPLAGERRPGSVGLPLPDVEIRVANEDGEILKSGETGVLEIKGPNVFKGYWQMAEKTAAEFRPDGFFITGDISRISPDGYVSIVGRAKDLIISGGYNVYPIEVEAEIDAVEGVAESAVIGLPHPDFGEGVTAIVVKKTAANLAEKEILKALEQRLAAYKRPKKVIFVAALPRNTMGKVQKNILRDTYHDLYQPNRP
jgi:malonyl-CoA/methylmalonyl-CoA synthetase